MTARSRWSLMPVVLLRQAGFPFSIVEPLRDVEAVGRAEAVLAARDTAADLAARVRPVLRPEADPQGAIGASVGLLRPVPPARLGPALTALPEPGAGLLSGYQDAVVGLHETWRRHAEAHPGALDRARHAVVAAFGDPALREVLFLSNDAAYPQFAEWLDGPDGRTGRTFRKMTDLLTMYLQRVATKNETSSHFGPIAVGRVRGDEPGISWAPGDLRRHTYFTHWAAATLAATFSRDRRLRERTMPRRTPLVVLDEGQVVWCEFDRDTGMHADWRLVPGGRVPATADEVWLLSRCTGDRRLRDLRAEWARRPGQHEDIDAALDKLVARGWVIGGWQIPIGTSRPLRHLASQLVNSGEDVSAELAVLDRFERFLTEFRTAPPPRRPALLQAAKEDFERVTGVPANRGGGTQFADRSIVFEEAHAPVRNLSLGPDLARIIATELAPVYDLVLVAPRLRLRRERELVRRWAVRRFGPGETPLLEFYAGYFADRAELMSEVDEVDAELARLDREILDTVLHGHDLDRHEVDVDPERVAALLTRFEDDQPALVGPDIMLAAADTAALARGEVDIVVGDCHAVHDLLTHTSVASIVGAVEPDVVDEVYRRYRGLLSPEELLVEVVRSHTDKTGARLRLPGPDLEAYGRSGKARHDVLTPADLHVLADADRLDLHAGALHRRLRLTTPLAGGLDIRTDPLSVFSFPRHFAGVSMLRDRALAHVPRIRMGRVVLRRETWRLPTGALRGWRPGGADATGDAEEFLGACAVRRELDLPRFAFAKITGEPKPFFVDWEAPLLVRQLLRLTRRSPGEIELSEMLPGPDRLWLDLDGRRVTSELRCSLFSTRT